MAGRCAAGRGAARRCKPKPTRQTLIPAAKFGLKIMRETTNILRAQARLVSPTDGNALIRLHAKRKGEQQFTIELPLEVSLRDVDTVAVDVESHIPDRYSTTAYHMFPVLHLKMTADDALRRIEGLTELRRKLKAERAILRSLYRELTNQQAQDGTATRESAKYAQVAKEP